MSNAQLFYKRETGNSAFLSGIESEAMVQPMDTVQLEGMTGKEIIELLDYDNAHNQVWCIKVSDIPKEYVESEDVFLYSPEYVKWLEEQIERV